MVLGMKVLNLHGNMIGDNGARAIADGIRYSRSLRTLIFRRNQMSSIGLEHMMVALEASSTMVHLDVSNNTIDLFAIHKLKELAKRLDRGLVLDTQATQPLAEVT